MRNLNILDHVLYKDDLIIALNKPSGIPVHAGPRKTGPSLEDYFEELLFDYHHPPHLAHRLDRDTSGVLILGRNKKALKKMGHLFETRQIKKTYHAIVHGCPQKMKGTLTTHLEKVKTKKGWYMRVCNAEGTKDSKVQKAITKWVVQGQNEKFSFLELTPTTGRTHQLRVHCQYLGCPIIGDWVYGHPEDDGKPLYLHAQSITLPLHHNQAPLTINAPAPDYFKL
jgi:RluA family pseudouridine synthase